MAAVADALRVRLITQGPLIDRFERAVADYVGARHAVAVSSGTAALHAAAFAAGLGPGDEVITSADDLRRLGELRPATWAREPRFVDIDARRPGTSTATPPRRRRGDRTRAIVPVSYTGLPVDLRPARRACATG